MVAPFAAQRIGAQLPPTRNGNVPPKRHLMAEGTEFGTGGERSAATPSMRRPAPSSLDVTPLPVAVATPSCAPVGRTTRLPSALSMTSLSGGRCTLRSLGVGCCNLAIDLSLRRVRRYSAVTRSRSPIWVITINRSDRSRSPEYAVARTRFGNASVQLEGTRVPRALARPRTWFTSWVRAARTHPSFG